MFKLRTVVALALVCLQVSGTPLDVYTKLGECFQKSHEGFFRDFFPYHIAVLPVSGNNGFSFSGAYKEVNLSGLENVYIKALMGSSGTVIQFNNTFSKINITGNLEGVYNSISYSGSIKGYAREVNLKGNVTYKAERTILKRKYKLKVTDLDMNVTVQKVSIPFQEGESPFSDTLTTKYFKNIFIYRKKYVEDKSINLINSRIDTSDKIAQVMKECNITV